MQKKTRIILKLLLIIVCVVCFLFLMKKDTETFRIKQPIGEGVAAKDVIILMQALNEKAPYGEGTKGQLAEELKRIQDAYAGREQDNLLYRDYIEMINLLSTDDQFVMKKKYLDDFYVLKKDWYDAYDALLVLFGVENHIRVIGIGILTRNESLAGEKIGEGSILSAEGEIYAYRSEEFESCFYTKVRAYADDDTLLVVKEKEKDGFTLDNIWIMEAGEGSFLFFFHGFEISYRFQEEEAKMDVLRESIADITFADGTLKKIDRKDERVSGRLLKVDGDEVELQNRGTYEVTDNCRIYQLYEELCEASLSDLRIGYDFADYVLDHGKICAVLIMRKENMESIRVAVMNSNFKSLYHDRIELAADCEMELIYGSYESRETKLVKEGETITIDEESEYLEGDRIELVPSVKSGKIQISSIDRNQGVPSCRGKLEILKTTEGLVLINELLLEEYLYSVVPSEMPASYPEEALKAQAVCARTYAYRYLINPGLPEIGAHVNDSVSYQVYNNIAENVNSTKAVKETTGTLLYYGDEAVSTYYYSTSCGFGTDAGVWNEENKEGMPYLSSIHISEENGTEDENQKELPGKMAQEEYFREYILSVHEEDYEREEAWYRWEYQVEEVDIEEMSSRLQKQFSRIYDIRIEERREGGAADKLVIETDTGIFEVTGEYNIRYTLNNGGRIKKQDGTETETGSILPSAYFVIDVVKSGKSVIGYTLAGGGYGHGVGMSQNGAKAMGNSQKSCEEILAFFYPGCYMKRMY